MQFSNLGYADVNFSITFMQELAGLSMLSLCVFYYLYGHTKRIVSDT